ncbi:all trans-polyprenyl-diphosphate synthase PDSS1-like [Amphiura filiformis]|uniref:all trans-polyprenyl-diphosphate synthase PDSS1-like n=1 Tax=Amphiura filiformis TaxID=82378 RepID=UPI003B2103B3
MAAYMKLCKLVGFCRFSGVLIKLPQIQPSRKLSSFLIANTSRASNVCCGCQCHNRKQIHVPYQFSAYGGMPLSQNNRPLSTDTRSFPKETCSPEDLTRVELATLHQDIIKELQCDNKELQEVSQYYFDGKGKAFRPMVVLLMARACNIHNNVNNGNLLSSQHRVSLIAEMIHTASLMHDDVIDAADTRRNKVAINEMWGQKKAILGGDFVLSVSSQMLARIGNEEVVLVLSQVIEDLVRGEFMQLGSKENENDRFSHYLQKTYKKTASLMAQSCKAAAVLGECNAVECEIAYQYGRNIGMAFQLIDDVLDFVSSDATMGKPTSADLKLGLATAPVLFASEKFPELNVMILRRFNQPGDVEAARNAVAKTDGIEQTRYLAQQHSEEAQRQILQLKPSPERQALIELTNRVITRVK